MTEGSGTAGAPRAPGRLRSILAGSAGNMVETFDWFVYATFALYFAKVFFPKGDPTAQLLNTAAVFAVGFLARPVGAWLMGLYADRVGRRAAMTVSILLMCGGSLLIGLCPSYARIGVAAPILLTLARILQGLSMGGEYGTSATYMAEMASRKHRGFWSGVFYTTLITGQLMATGTLLALQAWLSPEALQAWGWRVPFFVGGGLAVAVWFLRRGMGETPAFQGRPDERATTWKLIVRHPRESLIVMGLTAGGTLGYYTFTSYMQKFLVNTSGFSKGQATQITAAGLVLFLLVNPLLGALSDKVGRKPLLIAFGVLGMLCTWPILATLAGTHDLLVAYGLSGAALVIVACYSSVNGVVKAELFPAEIRALGVALPYSLANALFGGSAEYVALWFKTQGAESGFFTYVTVVIAGSLLVYLFTPDTRATSRIAED
ncbi:MFS transporter [Phenylobacterium aquaticum]|uniref:MFS transporter n=1 Tax=Phenylobacterium aquaticum TaxID=1763816 RepID=UPI001F5E0DD1|nr:MFS transporter [Phenylobacterium aquaticum]MCI3132748.1 MFS transporter [Phenylobacterium aquaticum]